MSTDSWNFPDWKWARASLASAEVTERTMASSQFDTSLAASGDTADNDESRESMEDLTNLCHPDFEVHEFSSIEKEIENPRKVKCVAKRGDAFLQRKSTRSKVTRGEREGGETKKEWAELGRVGPSKL